MHQVADRIKKPLKPADCLIIEDAPSVCKTVRAIDFPVLAVTSSHPAEHFDCASWVVNKLEPQQVKKKIHQLKLGI